MASSECPSTGEQCSYRGLAITLMDLNSIGRSASLLSSDEVADTRADDLATANGKMQELLERPAECDGTFCNFAINAVVGYMEEARQVE